MTIEEKAAFDKLSDTSYLFRVLFANAGFDLGEMTLNGTRCWHLYYGNAIVGAVTTRKWDGENDSCTYTNLRLYKYFQSKFRDCEDFLMSEYYTFENGKRVRFNFDRADKYTSKLVAAAETLDVNKRETSVDTLSDSLARLREFCDEFDERFAKSTLFKDVKALLRDYDRVERELERFKMEKDHVQDDGRSLPEERTASGSAEAAETGSQDSQL